jgi:hypothetical protein
MEQNSLFTLPKLTGWDGFRPEYCTRNQTAKQDLLDKEMAKVDHTTRLLSLWKTKVWKQTRLLCKVIGLQGMK